VLPTWVRRTVLATRGAFGGMAANDGPIPVAGSVPGRPVDPRRPTIGQYGIAVSEPVLDYRRLLARVREVVDDVDAILPSASGSMLWA